MNDRRGARGGGFRKRRFENKLVRPIVLLFKLMNRARVEIWLKDDTKTRFQGKIVGLDEFMNLTLQDTVEINVKKGTEKKIGTIVLKGGNICTVHSMDDVAV